MCAAAWCACGQVVVSQLTVPILRYVNRQLAVGCAPITLADAIDQRTRWCVGALQVNLRSAVSASSCHPRRAALSHSQHRMKLRCSGEAIRNLVAMESMLWLADDRDREHLVVKHVVHGKMCFLDARRPHHLCLQSRGPSCILLPQSRFHVC